MPLVLLPNLLGPIREIDAFLPPAVTTVMTTLDGLIAESESGGRSYLKRFKTKKPPHQIPIALLNKHTPKDDLDFLLEPVIEGETWGVVSDCGLPCLADPGAALVFRARLHNLPISAYPGPSSITHALMLSGLSGQHFSFHGYIAKDPKQREKELRTWEKEKGVTHIFIEAPYRNDHTLKACLETLHPTTFLTVGWNLTLPDEGLITAPVGQWKKTQLTKVPAIFLLRRDR